MFTQDTICALATASGIAAISVIRVSGEKSFEIANQIFRSKKNKTAFHDLKSHHIYFGTIHNGEGSLDEVWMSIFK